MGSAVGLGNLWRFPYIVGENGGGAFLIPFTIAFLIFGIPMMMVEIAAGRRFRGSVVTSLKQIRPAFRFLGVLPVLLTLAVFSYYLVIAGWVLAYVVFSFTGYVAFEEFTSTPLPVGAFFATLLITAFIVQFDVRAGIERANKYLMPVLFVMLLVMLVEALTLPGVQEGIRYYLTPDPCALTSTRIWIQACGQAFFSLGVGFGILLTYGSYLPEQGSIPRLSMIVAGTDYFVALIAGFIIFPIVFSFGFDPVSGPELAFITLPAIFEQMTFGSVFGPLFFVLLFIGALSSTISMMEVGVATFVDEGNTSRRLATAIISVILIALGLPSALSYAGFGITLLGRPFLDGMDLIFGSLLIPLVAALVIIAISWFWAPESLISEINRHSGFGLPYQVIYLLRYGIPAILIGILLFDLVSLFSGIELDSIGISCPFSTMQP